MDYYRKGRDINNMHSSARFTIFLFCSPAAVGILTTQAWFPKLVKTDVGSQQNKIQRLQKLFHWERFNSETSSALSWTKRFSTKTEASAPNYSGLHLTEMCSCSHQHAFWRKVWRSDETNIKILDRMFQGIEWEKFKPKIYQLYIHGVGLFHWQYRM